jgi:hypothetical protein
MAELHVVDNLPVDIAGHTAVTSLDELEGEPLARVLIFGQYDETVGTTVEVSYLHTSGKRRENRVRGVCTQNVGNAEEQFGATNDDVLHATVIP